MGFLSLSAAANLVNAIMIYSQLGPSGTFTPISLGWITGPIPVYAYLLVSTLATFVFSGITCHAAVTQLSVTDQVKAIDEKANRLRAGQESQTKVLESVNARMFLVEERIEHTRTGLSKEIADQGETAKRIMKANHEEQHKMLEETQGQLVLLRETLRTFSKNLNDQAETIKKINLNLTDNVDPQLAEFKETLRQLNLNSASATITMAKQADEIAEIKKKLEILEAALIKPKPQNRKRKREKVTGYIQILSKPQ